MHSKKFFQKSLVAIAVIGCWLCASIVFSAETSTSNSTALTNWLVALNTFRNVGAHIADGKLSQAKTQLALAATNLAQPYGGLAAQSAVKLESAMALKTNSPARSKALIQLCAQLHAYDAALRLQSSTSDPADLLEDQTYPWRLFESGDTKASLAEYKRRVTVESVELYRLHYQKQADLSEQRVANLTNVAFSLRIVQQHYLRGLEEKPDMLAAIEELHRVLPFASNTREAATVHQSIIKYLEALGDNSGQDAWENKVLRDFKSDTEACAGVYLERGLRAFSATNFDLSLSLLRKVCSDYPETEAYGDAQYTVGLIFQRQGNYPEAVKEFSKIFPSKINDNAIDPEKSDDYKNYRYRAALRISDCYETEKDFTKALTYAEMARDRYRFKSYCKSCLQEAHEAMDKRIQRLKDQLGKQTSAAKTN